MLKIYIRKVISIILRIFFMFPISKNMIFFDSMFGKAYSDNGKYVTEYIKKHYPGEYRLVWGFVNPSDVDVDEIVKVKYKSAKWFYFRFTAKVVIISHHIYNYMPIRKGQYCIMTWHAGGAYKRIGVSVKSNTAEEIKLHEYRNTYINKAVDCFVSSSEIFTRFNIKEVYAYNGSILESGMPRNDLLFDKKRVKNEASRFRESQGLSGLLILYAPTFRNGKIEQLNNAPNFEEVINVFKESHNQDVHILYRSHYYDSVKLSDHMKRMVVDVSQYPDMQQLLCAADILITDYSSSIWDFALLKKPCFLYVPDLDNYRNKEQGFFTPIEDWPGIICENMDVLELNLRNRGKYNFEKRDEEYLLKMGSYENGDACRKLVKLIESVCKERK